MSVTVLFVAFSLSLHSQYFNVNGDASTSGTGCYELTPAAKQQTGSVWSPQKTSLLNSFSVSGRFNFGISNFFSQGADGIAFALQPVFNTATGTGAGLGVGYIAPSLVAEFDTYKNGYDPNFDHVAIVKNGDPDHNSGNALAAPVQIKAGQNNVQDNSWYDFKITWDAITQTLSVEIDCQVRVSYSGNVINDIFGGNPDVYWGFSAATGDKFARHQVCVDATDLFKIDDQKICLGDVATVTLPTEGTNYSLSSWTPTTGIINSAAPNPTFSPTVTTEYIVSYEDACNNISKDTFLIEIEPAPTVNLGNDTSVCGAINLTLDAENTGSTYNWNTGAPGQTINAATAGTYWVEVTNPTGCVGQDTIVVSSGGGLTVNLGNDTSICGTINLTLDAGNGSTYLWDDGSSAQTLSVNSTGSYWVEVSDGNGCFGRDTIVVSGGGSITVNLGNDTTICSPTILTLDAQNTGSSYLWNDGSTNQTLATSTNGTYWVEVTAPSGCVDTDSIVINVNNAPTVNLGNDTAICGAINLTLDAGNSGNTFLWNDGSSFQTVNVTSDGLYWVDVSDAKGCLDRDTIILTSENNLSIYLGNDTAICQGENIIIDAGAITGASYLWNDGSTLSTLSANTSGEYSVEVTLPSGCVGRDTVLLTVNNLPIVNLGNDTTICNGSTVTIDAQNSTAAYLWNTGSTTQSINLSNAGKYWVDVSEGNCMSSDTIVVDEITFNVNLGNDTSICGAINLTLDATSANSSYLWNTGATTATINVTNSGQYEVTLTNADGCEAYDTINIQQISSPIVNIGSDTSICGTATLALDAGNVGSTYLWNDGSTNQSNTVGAGLHWVEVSNGTNCQTRDSIIITISNSLTVNLGNDTTICQGSFLTLDAKNKGLLHVWSTGESTQQIDVATAGQISVEVTDNSGCKGRDTIDISVVAIPVIYLPTDTTLCQNTDLILHTGNGTDNHSWTSGENTNSLVVSTPGSYGVIITNSDGCSNSAYTNVNLEVLDIQLASNFYHCEGEMTNLTPIATGNNINYLWNGMNNGMTLTTDQSGQHTLVASTTNCSVTKTTTLNPITTPSLSLSGDTVGCEGDSLTLIANSNSDVTWSSGQESSLIAVNKSGTYIATAKNSNNTIQCQLSDSISVTFYNTPNQVSSNTYLHCFDQISTLLVKAETEGQYYDWGRTITTNSQLASVYEEGIYPVTIYNHPDCAVEEEVLVEERCPLTLYIPNSFSPNGDGNNDLFEIKTSNLTSYEINIYNRWGQLIYHSTSINDSWNGTMNGKEVAVDVYIYQLTASGYGDNLFEDKVQRTGTVTIIR